MIALVGQDTHNAPGVKKEVTIANQLHKPIFQIRPQGENLGKVQGAGELIPWVWTKIDDMIDRLLQANRCLLADRHHIAEDTHPEDEP